MSYYALTDSDWPWDDEGEGRAIVVKADTPEEAVKVATDKMRAEDPHDGGICWKVARLNLVGFEGATWELGKEPVYDGFTYYADGINGRPDAPPSRPQPASAPADLWKVPIEELSRAKAGRFYDVANEHPNCALGEREAYVNKNWQNWREDAAIEVANLSQPASTALVERLTSALQPFAQAADDIERTYGNDLPEWQIQFPQLPMSDFRRARSALSSSQSTSREGESRG